MDWKQLLALLKRLVAFNEIDELPSRNSQLALKLFGNSRQGHAGKLNQQQVKGGSIRGRIEEFAPVKTRLPGSRSHGSKHQFNLIVQPENHGGGRIGFEILH